MQLYVYTALDDAEQAALREQLPDDVQPTFRTLLPDAEQQAAFRTAEILLGNPPPDWFEHLLPGLGLWQLDSAGFDRYEHVQTNAQVANMGDFFAWPCAETMMAGLLALYRLIPQLALLQSRNEWVGGPLREHMSLLTGKRVVILGAGTIGMALRQMLSGFNCPVKLMARTDTRAELHTPEALMAELPQTDILVNCLPGSARGFVSAEVLAALPANAIYANVGRGTTTDEAALIAALQQGKLAGAVLDVTETEPLPPDSPLWQLPNVLLTQHTGGGQPDENMGKIRQLLRNLKRYRRGEPIENRVSVRRGY